MLRVAAVQAEALPGEVDRNLASAADWVRRAARRGAGVVVFPEAFTTGYDEAAFADLLHTGHLPGIDLAWAAPVQAAVEDGGVTAVLNSPLDHGTHRTLSSVVLRPGERPVAAYAKQHLYASERAFFTPGECGASLMTGERELALSVCYDANFPEHAAAAAGADVYLNSGAYFPGGEHRRDLHYAARALDNGVYVVFAGLLGAPYGFIGGSAVFDPEGRIIDRVPPGTEGLAVADIDPERIAEVRGTQRMWADRRPGLGERHRLAPVGP
ncbi:carbon-nitrogen hydrolase family protein [Nocardioides sp. BP30]|uniref:carbon-nitrogen hydrolase family protein n=1 Tax=Nocardioides sp. BP30 TaxID=3036374 RepID=UPI0024682FA8|nr:carbon-nitrogen hydrolase family protein [Nocardioides sp. BP30]WGL51102.1 carbon-nitrogen hydrolase family protein [Nocardioides sp. BP30]